MVMKKTKFLFSSLLILIMFLFNAKTLFGIGIGVNPPQLEYIVTTYSTIQKDLWVFNTGNIPAQYTLYVDTQYQSLFSFSVNNFILNPGENQKVSVIFDPSKDLSKLNLNINLYVKGSAVNSNIEVGTIVKIKVIYQLSGTTTLAGKYFPLNPSDPEIINALNYFRAMQDSSGSIGGFSVSCWVVMAIASAGYDPHNFKKNTNSVVDYIINNKNQIDQTKVTDLSKFILALTAAYENPRNIGGVNYVSLLEATFRNNQFGDELMLNDDFWAVMALISAGIDKNDPKIQNAVNFIKAHQNNDGGWSWTINGISDVDDTAAAIMALIAAGENKQSSPILNALNYLKTQLHSDGGFIYMGEANAASNAWGIMALVATGVNPTSVEWVRNNKSPVDILLSLQNSDGSFSYIKGQSGSVWWTAYAIPALLGKFYPIQESFITQLTTTTTLTSLFTSVTTQTLTTQTATKNQVYIRIEDVTETVWRGWIEIPSSTTITCYNSGKSYNIPGDNVLAILNEASKLGGFTYTVSDQWYPDLGFYVDSINGHKAEGIYGWLYRVNYILGNTAINNFKIHPLDEILIYWGTDKTKPLKIEIQPLKLEIDVGESLTIIVKYRDDLTGEWHPLPGAIVHVNDSYITNNEGKIFITFNEKKVYCIYAEKWGSTPEDQYVKSDIVYIGVGVPIPEFSSQILFLTFIILTETWILMKIMKRRRMKAN
ncbi:MAG: prenyltransferase/squalene oxidase repeat-containing protein [Candidatus Bathyarchaeia archaeon]|nr:DUF4430 domain-containing protein [Candidatus Bathyarchaeota archaeon]